MDHHRVTTIGVVLLGLTAIAHGGCSSDDEALTCDSSNECNAGTCSVEVKRSCNYECSIEAKCTMTGGSSQAGSETNRLVCGQKTECNVESGGSWDVDCANEAKCKSTALSGTTHDFTCSNASTCDTVCKSGSTCNLVCTNSAKCTINCAEGAKCSCASDTGAACTCTGPGCSVESSTGSETGSGNVPGVPGIPGVPGGGDDDDSE